MHNHPCEERDVVGHIANRTLSKKHLDFPREQIGVFSVKPAALLEALRHDFPENNFYIKSVYNAVAKLRAEVLDGRTPVQMLVDLVTGMTDYSFDIKFNQDGKMKCFFFAYNPSVERMKMPFLEAVGMNSENKTFFLCGCFLTNEAEEDYRWAIKKMKEICFIDISPSVIATDRELSLIAAINDELPQAVHLLCRWHRKKHNSKMKTRLNLSGKRINELLSMWTSAVHNSFTEDDWNENFAIFAGQPEFQFEDG
ncbi:hypothetical protein [Parasitella parasitica]|uniref:MULE transposase domain-containing protein n=1 Tax=Parasitella parasitica TaxID=35722 RepID=A0A0B7NS24_9FUNG|nr:hypothetical protein [Parasitella parasitica]